MAAPPIPAPVAPGIPADVAPYVQGYLTLFDVLITVTALLAVGLVWALWRLASRRRGRHEWQVAYWHLLATATCPLCGSRMEGPAPQMPTGARQLAPNPTRQDLL